MLSIDFIVLHLDSNLELNKSLELKKLFDEIDNKPYIKRHIFNWLVCSPEKRVSMRVSAEGLIYLRSKNFKTIEIKFSNSKLYYSL